MIKNSNNTGKPDNTGIPINFEIPAQGSLGLLALGAVGIKAWREKRDGTAKQKGTGNE